MSRILLVTLAYALALHAAERKSELHFQTSDRCLACHNGVTTPDGQDISIGLDWRPTMMANSSRDPYWQGSVRRESIDHPESRGLIEDECSICHMPMARWESKAGGKEGEVFAHLPFDADKPLDRLAADGVSCSLCHQITKDKLGTRDSFVGGFVIDPASPPGGRPEYGPFKIEKGITRIMRSSTRGYQPTESEHIRQSEVCATCHTLYTKALGPQGKIIGELPEQVPYQEWLHSDYRETKSCQACHMPVIDGEVPISKVLGTPRKGVSRHVFLGGNFFMLRMLNRFRPDLNVAALPNEFAGAAERTVEHLASQTAKIAITQAAVRAGRLEAEISVENLGGHKLPTAYPSRRVWLHVAIRDANGKVVFESGALSPQGSIVGNDNDANPARYEPHYTEIRSADQVQIYESILADSNGGVTTGLLTAVGYLKDNRLLPHGFDKRTAEKDIAVHGRALEDGDFTAGGDRVLYSAPLGDARGPFRVDAEVWFQPISYRWASNLRPYNAAESQRFVGYYDSMAPGSAVVLAHASQAIDAQRP